jgi:hypothetical protein
MSKLFFLLLTVSSFNLFSQELNLTVSVKAPVNLKTDPAVYRTLEKDIYDFFYNTKFTEDDFQTNEKIKGKIQITITEELSNTQFLAEISIQTSRPVFNTDYVTPMMNYLDKGVTFNYIPGQPIQRSDKSYIDNLSSTLTFYAMMVLGFDYDSFELFGGDRYFNLARETFNNLPPSLKQDLSWTNQGVNGRSKYWLVENAQSPRLRSFRQLFYEYHRNAMDKFASESDKTRAIMLSSLSAIEDLHQSYPNSYLLQLFSDTKHQEIVEIFKAGDSGQRNKVRNLMSLTSLGNANRYDALK